MGANLTKIGQGPILERNLVKALPQPTINFGEGFPLTDDGEDLNRFTLSVNTGTYVQEKEDEFLAHLLDDGLLDNYFTYEQSEPDSPPTGSIAYVEGGYLHFKDSHSGHATIIASPRIDLSDHNQTIYAGVGTAEWGEHAWGDFTWGGDEDKLFANDFWMWKDGMTANRRYEIGSLHAVSGSAVTVYFTYTGIHSASFARQSGSIMFTTTPGTGSLISFAYDGSQFNFVGWKRLI